MQAPMPHTLQLPRLLLLMSSLLQPGAQPSLEQADIGRVIKGPPTPIYQCQHHDRPIIHRALGPPTAWRTQGRMWRLSRKEMRLERCMKAVSGPCDGQSECTQPSLLSLLQAGPGDVTTRTSRLQPPFLFSLHPSPLCLACVGTPHAQT